MSNEDRLRSTFMRKYDNLPQKTLQSFDQEKEGMVTMPILWIDNPTIFANLGAWIFASLRR